MEAPISALGGAVFKLPVKLDGLLRHGYMLPKGAEDEIPLIKRDLEEIIAILKNHISRLDYPSVMVNCWMKEVRELSYDIDDCIDQYEHAADSKSKYVCKIPRRKLTLRKTNRLSEKLKQRLWMANMIREFSARVQEALQRHELYNLGGIGRTPPPPTPTYDVPTRSPHHIVYGEAADLVGIDARMNKLEELLIKDGEQRLKVVSIVGVGGIGKTTLANEIYCKYGGQFDCRAFVRASQKPDMRRLLASMLSQVRPHQSPDTWKVHNLIAAIRTHLKDKRYLIIADDVWATSTWDTLNCALPEDNSCSRILITTEIEDVAHKCCGYESKYVFRMKPLGDDDSRKLFFNSMFGPQYECPPELREVSNNIIRKCGGVPLATVTIARLLASQMIKLEQWDYVNKSLGYGLRTNTTLEGMKQVLNLSYDNLPSHLKACMLYLSIYEEDYIIWKDDLVKQWIAEGFLCSTEEQDKEEIFGSYFDELVNRRMIQPVRINENDEVLSCVVHHMVLKLIAYKSIEENFVIAIDHSQTITRFADKVRRLSLHFGNTEDAMPPTNMRLSQVRTLAFFGVFKCLPSIVAFRLLRVLILHIWGDEDNISFNLTRISELFRLRYLQVACNVTLELRTQMRGLQCLETLKIDARASAIPSDIVHLPSLLHLNLPARTNLPNGIDHLTQLRTLGYFDLSGNSIENVQSLGALTNLQDLQLTCYTLQPDNLKSNMQCLGSILGKLSNLKSLTLVPTGGSSRVNILDVSDATSRSISGDGLSNVSSPPALIQRLELSLRVCIFSTVPTWIGHLGKLYILKIGVRELVRSDVDVLRGLPALTVLSLYVHTKPAERIVFDKAGFSVLKYFKFRCSVAWLKFEAGTMPNLRKLKLGFNAHRADRYSTTMPVGIEHLLGLTEISAKIGSTGAEESNRRSAGSALSESIKMHPGCPNINIQGVDQTFGGKDGESMGTQEEEHLSGLTEISAKIGRTSAEEPDRRFAESALSESINMHPGRPNVNIQCVDRMFGGKDGESMGTQEEEHLSGLTEISAKIRRTSAEEPDTRSAESALSQSIKMHPGRPNVNIQYADVADWMFFGKDDESMDSITTLDPIQGATPRRKRGRSHMESANQGEFRASPTTALAGTGTAGRTSSASSTQGRSGNPRYLPGNALNWAEKSHKMPDKSIPSHRIGDISDLWIRNNLDLAPTAVAEKSRASSKKNRRRQKKAAAAVAAPSPGPATAQVGALQRLFDTSREVFADSSPGFVPPEDAVARLAGLLNDIKPHDVGIESSMPYFKHADSKGPPRVTYLHFYDCSKFSFGIFCLPKSAVIPLHNHPGMTVFNKMLFGSMNLKSYDWARTLPDSDNNTLNTSDGARLAKVSTDAVFEASAETIVLYPENGGNLHCFTALTPCAVLDVMGPPYNRADGRDCSYYNETPYSSSSGGDEQYSWLKVIPSTFEMKGVQMPRRFIV